MTPKRGRVPKLTHPVAKSYPVCTLRCSQLSHNNFLPSSRLFHDNMKKRAFISLRQTSSLNKHRFKYRNEQNKLLLIIVQLTK